MLIMLMSLAMNAQEEWAFKYNHRVLEMNTVDQEVWDEKGIILVKDKFVTIRSYGKQLLKYKILKREIYTANVRGEGAGRLYLFEIKCKGEIGLLYIKNWGDSRHVYFEDCSKKAHYFYQMLN